MTAGLPHLLLALGLFGVPIFSQMAVFAVGGLLGRVAFGAFHPQLAQAQLLARGFRAATGMPPYAYILRARIALACRLLEGGRLPVQAVGAAAGVRFHASTAVANRPAETIINRRAPSSPRNPDVVKNVRIIGAEPLTSR